MDTPESNEGQTQVGKIGFGWDLIVYLIMLFGAVVNATSSAAVAFLVLNESVASRFCPGTALVAIPCTVAARPLGIIWGLALVVGAIMAVVSLIKLMVNRRRLHAYIYISCLALSAVSVLLRISFVVFQTSLIMAAVSYLVYMRFIVARQPSDEALISNPMSRLIGRIINIILGIAVVATLGLFVYGYLTLDARLDKATVTSLKEIIAEKKKEALDQGRISESSYYDNQPLQFEILSADSFRVCAVFYTDASKASGTDIDRHGKGKECFSRKVSFDDYYTRTARIDKGAYVSSITDEFIDASSPSGETVYVNVDSRVEFVDKNGSKIRLQDIKVANTIDVYWKINQADGDTLYYAYKVVLADKGVSPRFCKAKINGNAAAPQCPDTYLGLTIRQDGTHEPGRYIGATNKNGIQIDVYWKGGPTVVVGRDGKIVPIGELKSGQVFDVVWNGERPEKLVIK